jgi:hypothetical protein
LSNRISFIELEVKKCTRVYGSAPCTAAVGVTGDQKCFNSRATCQDLNNILEANELVRLAKPSAITPDEISSPTYIENIESISYTPPVLDLGRSIGVRASLSVSFKDHRSPDTDASGDPYLADRDYDPYTLGTYFGKLKARHPFLRGQSIYWVQGRDDQSLSDMERRHLIVEDTTGPNSSGTYGIVAKDALKLAQGDRALAPRSSNGYITNAISSSATSLVLSPFGVGDLEYPASGKAAIGGAEIVSFTRSADTLTITRAQNNTVAVSHEVDDRVQLCLVYSAQTAPFILKDLLVNYATVPSSYIPISDWNIEHTNWLNRAYTTLIAEPTPVNTLVNEILEQTASTLWWDNLGSLLRWSVLKNSSSTAFEFNESNYIQGSFNIADQISKRVSRVIIRYGQINPLLNITDQRNYAAGLVNIDDGSEAFFNNVPAYREINSRWILGDQRDTASTMAELITQRYAKPPRRLGFKLLRDALGIVPELASPYSFKNLYIQDDTGAQTPIPIQVTSVNPSDSEITVNAEEVTFTAIIARDANLVTLNPGPTFESYNIYDRTVLETGVAPTASTVVNVFIDENITIGSTGTDAFAMTTGSGWPAGATINLYVQPGARLLGAGGSGGVGGSAKSELKVFKDDSSGELYYRIYTTITSSPTTGSAGGPALEVLHPINITNYGIIGGGGGGGGGGGAAAGALWLTPYYSGVGQTLAAIGGNGGGGGAGYPAGSGGASGSQINVATRYGSSDEVISGTEPAQAEWTDPSLYIGPITLPFGGRAGGTESGGAVRSNPFQYSKRFFSATKYFGSSAISDTNGVRGAGGDLGDIGVRGSDGLATWSIVDIPTNAYDGQVIDENGVNPGAAGRAIEKNGNTVTFLVTGDIRGAII